MDDYLKNQTEDGGGPDMVDQTLAEQNVPTLTDQKHVDYICRKLFGSNMSSLLPIKKVLQMKLPLSLHPAAE